MRWVRRRRQSIWLLMTLSFLGLSLARLWGRFQASQPPQVAAVDGTGTDPYVSAAACRRGLARGQPAVEGPAARADALRVLSWNLRWFPYGVPPERVTSATPNVDVQWLACILIRERVSVAALQEVVADGRGRAALSRLTDTLTELGATQSPPRGPFEAHLDPCPPKRQHLAYLVDRSRHPRARVEAVPSLNPVGAACAGGLRPGLKLTLESPRVALLNMHLDSGRAARDARNREASLRRAAALGQGGGPGLVLLGDLNLMGCQDCAPAQTPEQEGRALLDALQLRPLDVDAGGAVGCSHYHGGRGLPLDRALAIGDVPSAAVARVRGPCAKAGCSPSPTREHRDGTLAALSDHCPLLVTF